MGYRQRAPIGAALHCYAVARIGFPGSASAERSARWQSCARACAISRSIRRRPRGSPLNATYGREYRLLRCRALAALTIHYPQVSRVRAFIENRDPLSGTDLIVKVRADLLGEGQRKPLVLNRVAMRILMQGQSDLLFDLPQLRN